MQKYQDTMTGIEWHFEDDVIVAELTNVPATLSAQIIPRPSQFHDWNAGVWVLNVAAKTASDNATILGQIAEIESAQVRPTRELLIDPLNVFARNKIVALDAQIAALRKGLK